MAIEARRVQIERQRGKGPATWATSYLLLTCCEQQGWLYILLSLSSGFGRDEVMMGAVWQGPFPWRGGLGAEAVITFRQKTEQG